MAEIEFTIPTVQYGNLKVRATPEELGIDNLDAYSVGVSAAAWLNLATQGFEYGKTLDLVPDHVTGQYQESPEHKVGDVVTVGGIEFTKHSESPEEMYPGAKDPQAYAESLIKDQLGATTVKPWTVTPSTTTAKQWEDFDV